MAIGFSSSVNGLMAALSSNNVHSNNIANVNSKGFKAGSQIQSGSFNNGPNNNIIRTNLSQGSLTFTDNPLDIAIAGKGFIELETASGEKVYTRTANLQLDGKGHLVDNHGNRLSGVDHTFANSENIIIQSDGKVMSLDKDGEVVQVGKIMMATFNNPQGLSSEGNGLYQVSQNSGVANPAENPNIIQGALENSNVDLATEITGQMIDSASVKANLSAIKTHDDMLGEIVDLKG